MASWVNFLADDRTLVMAVVSHNLHPIWTRVCLATEMMSLVDCTSERGWFLISAYITLTVSPIDKIALENKYPPQKDNA
jgi:hypothetical protein